MEEIRKNVEMQCRKDVRGKCEGNNDQGETDMHPNTIVWVDIPVRNLQRAAEFYSFILGTELSIEVVKGIAFVPFPHNEGQPSGCLVEEIEFVSNANSLLVYFNVEGRMDEVLAEVDKRGGRIIRGKEKIGPWGYRAIILDCEKSRIALYTKR